jgi:hypothetical protein
MGWDALRLPEWERWLLAVAGKSRVRSGQKLDPFGTSWRVLSTQGKPWLEAIHAGRPISREDRAEQVPVDLRAAGLVEGGAEVLTPVGAAVLERWKDFPEDWEYELPLAVALLQEALSADADGFRSMLAFWWDIRQAFDEEELFAAGETLLLLPYLNQTKADFNPWAAMREGGDVAPSIPWDALEALNPSGASEEALHRLRTRLDPSRRLKARIVFCRAMSLLFERHAAAASAYLEGLRLPQRFSQ